MIITEKPKYFYSKRNISRYSFSAKNYKCRFWLSEGALDVIKNSTRIKMKLKTLIIMILL
jgi:hypothetical protein